MPARLIALLTTVVFILTAMIAPLAAADGARVMLVLDASGSMWGKVGETTKIEAARQTVATILQDWRPEDQLGLVVYGHRQKGLCSDIEVMKPVGPVDTAALLGLIGSISPKGRTPMTEAVRQAAESLRGVEGKASVILVSDGIETCDADPCAVAASLKKADIDLVIHTVGFDIQDPEAKRQLTCMAEATGGLALTAADAKDLTKAIQEAVYTAQKEAPPVTEEAPPPPPAPVVKQEAKPEWNLTGYVRLAEGDDPIGGKEDVSWEFHRPAPEGVTPDYITTSYNPNIHVTLEPGDYVVTTHVGAAIVKNKITIAPNRMNQLDVILNAGRLGLRAKRTETENQVGDVRWEVVNNQTSLYTSYNAETSTVMPAGEYTVTMTLGAAKISRDVQITPGETTAVEIIAGVGKLKGKVTFSPGGPIVKDCRIEIYTGAEPAENESPLATTYESEPSIDLPAGVYRVDVTAGGAKRTFPLVIKPGDRVQAAFPMDAGLGAFDAPGAEGVIITSSEADIYGELKEITRLYTLPAQYVLPTGHYKAVAYKGDTKVEAAFDIKPGQRTQTSLQLPPN